MQAVLNIPTVAGDPLALNLSPGNAVFVVGSNGSGKSSLIQHAVTSLGTTNVKRIAAHRQLSFRTGSVDMTAASRKQFGSNLAQWERSPQHRWMEHDQESRLASVLFDLMAMENTRARLVTELIDANDTDAAAKLAKDKRSPFRQINAILNSANLHVTIECHDDEEIVARRGSAHETYSIAKMSDGERSAVLMAAEVLTAQPGTILLIDEPERHLHRSIIQPLLSSLFAQRPDCPFIISTHEVELPMADPASPVLMVRSCTMDGDTPDAWDVEILAENTELPDDLKRSILGSRRTILFVEGEPHKLDQPLYEALFPHVSVIAKGSCDDVINAVKGLRSSLDHHRVEAFGLIDRDFRGEPEIVSLAKDGIFALQVYSVESLYYCSDAIEAAARHQEQYLGLSAGKIIQVATGLVLKSIHNNPGLAERMAARRSERIVRNRIREQMPDWKGIQQTKDAKTVIAVASPFAAELTTFNSLAAEGQIDEIIARYPVRDSEIFGEIVSALQITRNHYERLLPILVRDDPNLANRLRQRIQPLADAIGQQSLDSDPTE